MKPVKGAKSKPVVLEKPPAPEPKKKSGGFFGLFGGGDEDTPPEAPKPASKPAVKETPPEPQPAKKSGGFLGLFGGGDDEPEDAADVPDSEKPMRPKDWDTLSILQGDEVKFFEGGPLQTGGPDDRLKRGTMVTVVQAGKGWTKVKLESGQQGYVGTSELRRARESDFRVPPPPAPIVPQLDPAQLAAMSPLPDLPDSAGPTTGPDASLLMPSEPLEPIVPPGPAKTDNPTSPLDEIPLPSPDAPATPAPTPEEPGAPEPPKP